MSWPLPAATVYSVKRRQKGIVVWSLQRALRSVGFGMLADDGIFGVQTEQAVKNYQAAAGLTDDGIFGPATSAAMAQAICQKVGVHSTPDGLLLGMVGGESGKLIGAVNTQTPGGIDCGYTQRRVLEADYANDSVVQSAFDSERQINILKGTLVSRHAAFYGQPGAKTHELAWRLAALYHNYPYGATEYAAGRWPSPRSQSPAAWVQAIGAKFPDGAPIATPHEWCCHYALGDPAHDEPGMMVASVTNWAVA